MTDTVLVAGSASHVGKSTIVAGLCRLYANQGEAVAPFKGQNMSNNAHVALTPDDEWGEIGVSQYVQAQAAGITPTTDLNPVLLKPRGEDESQLIIQGDAVTHLSAGAYYEAYWEQARDAMIASYDRLAKSYEIIVAEGAGSIAEINLHDRDLANVETALHTDASIIIVVDIERGGAFASLYGTLSLMPAELREQVVGAIITKFRGDRSLLRPGTEELERLTDVPILGVLPYTDPGLPAEDSVSLPAATTTEIRGDDDDIPASRSITIGVPRLPHLSNFTDLTPLERTPGVRIAYLSLDRELSDLDAIVLPGTKNTVDDLEVLHESGMAATLRDFAGPIVGICGGYQLLGERLTNAQLEGTGDAETVEGIGLLPIETRFSVNKTVSRVTEEVTGAGPIAGATGSVTGYEIHMGDLRTAHAYPAPLGESSIATDQILGTYVHGLFENESVRKTFIDRVYADAGKARPAVSARKSDPYRTIAELLTTHVDLTPIGIGE